LLPRPSALVWAQISWTLNNPISPGSRLWPGLAGAPVRQPRFVEALGHARVPLAGCRPGPTPNVDSMMVLCARRGATGSK
jgi:hypothetical protein